MRSLLDRYGHLALESLDMAALMTEIFETIQRHHVAIPADLMLMGKAIATMEGIAQELHPAYDPLTEMRTYLLRVYVERLADPTYLAKGVYRTVDAWVSLARQFPRQAESILTKLDKGQLNVRIEDEGLRTEARNRARATNRLTLAILASALGATSTVLLINPLGPTLAGLSLTTIAGLFGAVSSLTLGNIVALGALRANLD
jgi:ubiquinone biosynthesis protein